MRKVRGVPFFLLVPGMILFVLPLYLGIRAFPNDHIIKPLRLLSAFCWIVGGSISLASARALFTVGHGSPSPADPPKVLVTSGPFRYSRNPLYLGGLIILLGHLLFFQSRGLLLYLPVVMVLFRSIVVFREEPYLRRQFGKAYEKYCGQVPRWFGIRSTGAAS
jgi:protein-S-isoprenylcysteine O-methyltransferase Ste14